MSAASETSKLNQPISNTNTTLLAGLPIRRLDFAAAALISGAAVVVMVIYLVTAIAWTKQAFLGVMLTADLSVDGSRPLADTPWPGLAAGLQWRDQILSINGQTLPRTGDYNSLMAAYQNIIQNLHVGDTVQISFKRHFGNVPYLPPGNILCSLPTPDNVTTCVMPPYRLSAFPTTDFLADFLVPFVSGLIILIIGIGVLFLRPQQPAALLVTSICALAAIFMGGLFDVGATYRLNLLWIMATVSLGGAAATLGLTYPLRSTLLYRAPQMRYAPLALSTFAGLVLVLAYLNPPDSVLRVDITQLSAGLALLGVAVLVFFLARRRKNAISPEVRDQSNTILIGFGLALAPGVIWLANIAGRSVLGYEPIPFNVSASMPFIIPAFIAMAYAVIQYRRVDTDRIISQGITYTVMLIALGIGYFLLVFSGSLIAKETMSANDPILIAVAVFLVAALFLPVRTNLQRRIDRLYFRRRMNYQSVVEAFSQKLTLLVGFEPIITEFRTQLENALAPMHVFVFLPNRQTGEYVAFGTETDVHFSKNSPMIPLLRDSESLVYLEAGRPWPTELLAERARLLILKPLVMVGIRGGSQLNGFVVVGAPRSGRKGYTYEELRFVQSLVSQITVAIERAQVVDSLERRVRELDVLSQVSQAANFTVSFDDLLELISTQTGKLIETSHFYIVLQDATGDELAYAFFLENGERYEAKENKKWLPGHDLFSEVMRTGQALRVPDYPQALKDRGLELTVEDPRLKAWMAVPLLAGSRRLGVLAVATAESGKTYSDDQLKIFQDIASLAATSLDKARLFAETNSRARQLSALNDISQQLVATEADLEKLLSLIMSSASDILESEAGSLFLTADDGSGDLEFKVVIGGSGSDLVGKRVPAKRGLVGQVAATGKPVIVRDVINDPRWGGEFAKGAFHTRSILAVPLITQNKVIGVLEVLNKKVGTFTPDDVALLTTFAGQAAVAIENARLFQMTDLQLSERVTELETLERIDVDLNRALDLSKAAEITIRWAVANTSATAAALGMVSGDPPRMEIVSLYGYKNDEAPEGAEGTFWPLDRGIVSRVMRTRRADLVTDVSIDPNYAPSLRGTKSQMTVPLLSAGEINAILVLEKDKDPSFSLVDLAYVQRLAEHASVALVNSQLYAELTRANDSKSEFVGFVAHELKNPLTSIKGFADLLLSGMVGTLSDQQKNFLGTIRFNVDRMNTLVSDLNDVTRLQTNKLGVNLSPVDLRNVVTETLRPLQKQIEDKQQVLDVNVPENLPLINADQNRLIQVMTNLVSNAYKYSPPKGRITITAALETDRRDSKGKPIGPVMHVSVRDTGIGMSEEDLARLFTPYFRSENPQTREQPGTGLGLTITRGIIQRHNGEIWLESKLDEGTAFHFTVPIVTEEQSVGAD